MNHNLPIKGFEKVSLIDFEPYVASIIFLGGCNLRCRFCHNPSLVFNTQSSLQFDVIDYIKEKKNWIDGVCITGGEPTIHSALPNLISDIKNIGLKVKLDTNGTNPDMVINLIESNLIDKIAMDIKGGKSNYNNICNVKVDINKIYHTISIIMNSGIDYEFRTTVVPNLITKDDIEDIGRSIKGAKKWILQNFRYKDNIMDNSLKNTYTTTDLNELKSIAQQYINNTYIR